MKKLDFLTIAEGAWEHRGAILALLHSCLLPCAAAAQPFQLPTANRALYEKGGEERFFVGTTGKPWTSGTFGCVRTDGGQMHEGLDIRCLQRDKRGEPADPVCRVRDSGCREIGRA